MKALWGKSGMMVTWKPQGTDLVYLIPTLNLRGLFQAMVLFHRKGTTVRDSIKDPITGQRKVYPTLVAAKDAAETHAKSRGWTGDVDGE